MKLLYIADRELLAGTGRPLTGDRAVAMKNGPVLSALYDVVKQQSIHSPRWAEHVRKNGYWIELVRDPGMGQLSKGEAAKLDEVFERYHAVDDWELSEQTHTYKEWQDHFREGTSVAIPWQDVLAAQGQGDRVAAVAKDEAARRIFDSVFGYSRFRAATVRERGAHLRSLTVAARA